MDGQPAVVRLGQGFDSMARMELAPGRGRSDDKWRGVLMDC